MCGGKPKRPASDEDAETVASNGASSSGETALSFFTAGLQAPLAKPSELLASGPVASEPMVVYTGPKKTGAALIAAVAVETQKQTERPRGKKKSQIAAKKTDAAGGAKGESKKYRQGSKIRTEGKTGHQARQCQAGGRPESDREAGSGGRRAGFRPARQPPGPRPA